DDSAYSVLSGVGVGGGIAELYGRVGEANLRRWLPFEPRPDEVRTWVLNRAIGPGALALTLRDSLIEQAAIREALRLAIEEISLDEPPSLLIGSGAPARAVDTTLGTVLLLDALSVARPRWRRVEIALDPHNVLTALGALASVDPDMAAEVWEHDAPLIAATVVSARGAKRGMPAVLVTARWGETVVENQVPEGALHPVQPPAGESLVVELAPQRSVQVEGARRKQPARLHMSVSARNALPQLLLDTRPATTGGEARAAVVATYLSSSGAYRARDLENL
ncbi:MAG: hypothetical protein M3P51_17340, partial [Chloroflexota bacterium]|nr:hypothetical protein [Chloroflexota bacterium]